MQYHYRSLMGALGILRVGASLAAGLIAIGMALFPPWMHTAELAAAKPAHQAAGKSGGTNESSEEAKSKEDAEPRGEPAWRELRVSSTYAWLWKPPRPPKDWPVPQDTYWSVGLDTQRLILQYAMLGGICGCIWLGLWRKNEDECEETGDREQTKATHV
jgi:hypothetical protein